MELHVVNLALLAAVGDGHAFAMNSEAFDFEAELALANDLGILFTRHGD